MLAVSQGNVICPCHLLLGQWWKGGNETTNLVSFNCKALQLSTSKQKALLPSLHCCSLLSHVPRFCFLPSSKARGWLEAAVRMKTNTWYPVKLHHTAVWITGLIFMQHCWKSWCELPEVHTCHCWCCQRLFHLVSCFCSCWHGNFVMNWSHSAIAGLYAAAMCVQHFLRKTRTCL